MHARARTAQSSTSKPRDVARQALGVDATGEEQIIHYKQSKDNPELLSNVTLIGVLGVHVDDVRCTGNARFEKVVKPDIQNFYEWGPWGVSSKSATDANGLQAAHAIGARRRLGRAAVAAE